MIQNNKAKILGVATLVTALTLGSFAVASADTVPATSTTTTVGTTTPGRHMGFKKHRTEVKDLKFNEGMGQGEHGIVGTVASVSGNTLSVTGRAKGTTTPITYTVDASNAKILKAGATKGVAPTTITVSGIATGDNVMIQGTVSGTSVTATSIMDGTMKFARPMHKVAKAKTTTTQ